MVSNLSFLSPAVFQQQNRNQTLKSSPEPSQAWSQHILGRLERASTYAASRTGDNIWQQKSPGSSQQGSWRVPCAGKQNDGLPHQPVCCRMRGRAQTNSLCVPCALSTVFFCSSPAALLAGGGAAVHTLPMPGLALCPHCSRLQLPELLSRARMSRKSGFLDTGLMLEERPARQN